MCVERTDYGSGDEISAAVPGRSRGRSAGWRKPQRARIQMQQARRWRGGVAKLETQFDRGGHLRRRARQQQVGITHGVERRGAAEGAADLIASDRLAHVM